MKFVRDMIERRCFPNEYYELLTTCCWEGCTTPAVPGVLARRSFGWDMCEHRRPKTFSDHAIFHSGYTGQTIAVDPVRGFGAVILASRTGNKEEASQARVRLIDTLCR